MNKFLIIIIICLLILIYIYKNKLNNKQPIINQQTIEQFNTQLPLTQREQINNFSDSFFNFNNRINQSSIHDDPVDRINRDRTNCNFNVGLDIKEIYDNYTKPSM